MINNHGGLMRSLSTGSNRPCKPQSELKVLKLSFKNNKGKINSYVYLLTEMNTTTKLGKSQKGIEL